MAGGGSRPWHWTLGYAGARLLAARRGADPPRPGAWATRLERPAESPEKVYAYLGERTHFRGERDRRVWVESLAGVVLFWLPSTRRETALRELLVRAETGPLPIATAARDHGDPEGPAGQVWLPLPIPGEIASPARRMRIGQLAAGIGGTEPGGQPSTLARARRRRRDQEQAEHWCGEPGWPRWWPR